MTYKKEIEKALEYLKSHPEGNIFSGCESLFNYLLKHDKVDMDYIFNLGFEFIDDCETAEEVWSLYLQGEFAVC
jgi:hypothetical protein